MSNGKEIQLAAVTPIEALPVEDRQDALTGYLPLANILSFICGEKLAPKSAEREPLAFTTQQHAAIIRRLGDIAGVTVCITTQREGADNLYNVRFVTAVYPAMSDHIGASVRRLGGAITADPRYWPPGVLNAILRNAGLIE